MSSTVALAVCVVAAVILVPATHASAATFVVTNTNDAGGGSLRDMIGQANVNPGADIIDFAIGGGGVQVIRLLTELPSITDPVTIRGYTQPGAQHATAGTPARLRMVINAIDVGYGLDLQADDSRVSGLVIRSAAGPVPAGSTCNNDGLCVTGSRNVITGNYIGTGFAGASPFGNEGDGIQIVGDDNRVGGTDPENRNVISDNHRDGIDVEGARNVVQGNLIGTNDTGTIAFGNDASGIDVGGNDNVIGGTNPGGRNVISGNTEGVLIAGDNNTVDGNLVGTDVTGLALLANVRGVTVGEGANNRVGTTDTGNIIACDNSNACVRVDDASGTAVQGNFIGTDVTGMASFLGGGGGTGIDVAAGSGTVISGNVIARMRDFGLDIDGDGTTVEDNKIGTGQDGIVALGNNVGVRLTSLNSQVGGALPTQANIISGNVSHGVQITNLGSGNHVEGNQIGLDASGAALGNGGHGVNIDSGSDNWVGGSAPDAGNVIVDSGGDGVLLDGDGHHVEGNLIGTAPNGAALGNGGHGVNVDGEGHQIGGSAPDAGNIIADSGGDGVHLDSSAEEIQILANAIVSNTGSGVLADGDGNLIGTTDPSVTPNTITSNNNDGITVVGSSSTALAHNVIFDNVGLGIDLIPNNVTLNDVLDGDAGANGLQNYPVINSATNDAAGVTTVDWSLNSSAGDDFRIEFFASNSCDPLGNGEGELFLDERTVETKATGLVAGSDQMANPAASGQHVVATATLLTAAPAEDATSEFSTCVTVP